MAKAHLSRKRVDALVANSPANASTGGSSRRNSSGFGPSQQMQAFHVTGWMFVAAGGLAAILSLLVIHWAYIFPSVVGMAVGLVGIGVLITTAGTAGIVLRLGKPVRAAHAGISLTVPFLHSVKSGISVALRKIVMVVLPEGEYPKFLLHWGYFFPRSSEIWFQLGDSLEDLVASQIDIKDVEDWLRKNMTAHVIAYTKPMTPAEVTDEGLVRGNLIDRIREGEDIMEKKLELLRLRLEIVRGRMKDQDTDTREVDTSNPLLDQLELEIARVEPLPRLYRNLAKELDAFLGVRTVTEGADEPTESSTVPVMDSIQDHGIKRVDRALFGELKLSPALENAREQVAKEMLAAEAALYKGLQESAMRTAPILDMYEKLMAAGMGKDYSMEKALEYELQYKLADEGGAWAIGLGMGDNSIAGPNAPEDTIWPLLLKFLQGAVKQQGPSQSSGKKIVVP